MADEKVVIHPIEQLKAELAADAAAKDAVAHRLITIIEHCVLYLTSADAEVPPPIVQDPEVN